MKSSGPDIAKFAAVVASMIVLGVLYALSTVGEKVPSGIVSPLLASPTPRYTDAELAAVATVATYEAQIFPEPLKSQAYSAIAWTMRNRVEQGFGGNVDYTDEQLLSRYSSYEDHKDDPPDPQALEIARQVLGAEDNEADPTHGARHYVDNSYWTGTHDQTGNLVKVLGRLSDFDVSRLKSDSRFTLTIEWKTASDHPKGALVYGLYFFDYWPPPMPVVTPTFTPTATPRPTSTRTPTPRPAATKTGTPRPIPTMTAAATISAAATLTPTTSPTPP